VGGRLIRRPCRARPVPRPAHTGQSLGAREPSPEPCRTGTKGLWPSRRLLCAIACMDEAADLRHSAHWRLAVWRLRVMAQALLSLPPASSLLRSTGTGQAVSAVGIANLPRRPGAHPRRRSAGPTAKCSHRDPTTPRSSRPSCTRAARPLAGRQDRAGAGAYKPGITPSGLCERPVSALGCTVDELKMNGWGRAWAVGILVSRVLAHTLMGIGPRYPQVDKPGRRTWPRPGAAGSRGAEGCGPEPAQAQFAGQANKEQGAGETR
jgi:hypothetical protein